MNDSYENRRRMWWWVAAVILAVWALCTVVAYSVLP